MPEYLVCFASTLSAEGALGEAQESLEEGSNNHRSEACQEKTPETGSGKESCEEDLLRSVAKSSHLAAPELP